MSSMQFLLHEADADVYDPIPTSNLAASILYGPLAVASAPPSRRVDASPSSQGARARTPEQRGARIDKSSTSPKKPSPFIAGTALMKSKNVYNAELAQYEQFGKDQTRYSDIRSTKVASKPSSLSSPIYKRFRSAQERAEYFQKLVAPSPPPAPRPKTVNEQQRLFELETLRKEKDEKLREKLFKAYKRSLDRITMARHMSNGDSAEKMRILAAMDEKKSNPTKRAVAKLRQKLAEEHFARMDQKAAAAKAAKVVKVVKVVKVAKAA